VAARTREPILLRIPASLKTAVAKIAEQNRRSSNSEIQVALEKHVAQSTTQEATR
jgi:hypothetical protein